MDIFSYIIQMGASVMMPVLFTVIGLCIGMKFGKALKSGVYVGVGFVGLGIVTALLTDNSLVLGVLVGAVIASVAHWNDICHFKAFLAVMPAGSSATGGVMRILKDIS